MVTKISGSPFSQVKMQDVASSKRDDRFIPSDYKNVAKGMEQQFVEYMLSQMNNTVDKAENENQDSASSFYESIQTTERAKAMSENRDQGVGIQKIILDQIYPERLRTKNNYENYQKLKEQNALHKKMIQAYKPESNSIAIRGVETDKVSIAKGEVK